MRSLLSQAALSSETRGTAHSCAAHIISLTINDVDFLSAAVARTPADHVGVVMASSAGGGARRIAAATPTPRIYMVPEVATGLLVGLLLIIFLSIGLSCITGVKAPDVMHSTTLIAGKEY